MEVKISKNLFYTITVGLVIVFGGIAWASRGNNTSTPPPYAGVAGADLPTRVGEPTLDTITKIPYTETANYMEYTPEILATAKSSGKAVLLYFYADWCSSCKAQEPMNAVFFGQALIKKMPVFGIRIDIDDHTDIARQYGINYQHSYVLLDTAGVASAKFFGEHSETELMAKVQQVL